MPPPILEPQSFEWQAGVLPFIQTIVLEKLNDLEKQDCVKYNLKKLDFNLSQTKINHYLKSKPKKRNNLIYIIFLLK